MPNLRHLRLFEAAIRLSSLTLAAEEVHLSQPAASQAVARLERLFDTRLMDRTSTGVVATAAGAIVTNRICRALAHLAEASRRIAARAKLGRGASGNWMERHATTVQLRALVSFAQSGSFSAAARTLQQTEPAVQRAAREMEQLIGLPLFEGMHRNIRLTTIGEIIAMQAALALKEMATAVEELREHRGKFNGRLVIGTLPLPRTRIVPDAVVTLIQRHPDARIEIVDGDYQTLVRALRTGACDLIVGALREARCPSGLVETPLFNDQLSIVARAGHPLGGKVVTPDMLAQYPWVLPRRETPARGIFERLVAGQGGLDPARGYVETGSLVALRGILSASDAISIMSVHQIDYELRQAVLTVLDVSLPDTTRPIGVTALAHWQPTALQREFLAALGLPE